MEKLYPLPYPRYELGIFADGRWKQWADSDWVHYYQDLNSDWDYLQMPIPAEYEDDEDDKYEVDKSKMWTQWRNTRTGRIETLDPGEPRTPPLPPTYLEHFRMKAHLDLLDAHPDAPVEIYNRCLGELLNFFFCNDDQFSVIREIPPQFLYGSLEKSSNEPQIDKVKWHVPGLDQPYDYLFGMTAVPGTPWPKLERAMMEHCSHSENEAGELHVVLHVGLELTFYYYENGQLQRQHGPDHLRDDVREIMRLGQYVRRRKIKLDPDSSVDNDDENAVEDSDADAEGDEEMG